MTPILRIGLPGLADNAILEATQGRPLLMSVGAFYRPSEDRLRPIHRQAWMRDIALDCGGYTAMLKGGYRWSVAEYVEWVMRSPIQGGGCMPFPWTWWAAMDYCCEPEIAKDRAEVRRRMRLTVDTYAETLEMVDGWRMEGVTDLPDPMPTLQGRLPEDYLWSSRELAKVCRHGRLPDLVGVGSVCRRAIRGDDGLLTVLDALHEALPMWVRLHLFGVKGEALRLLDRYGSRVLSVDSMAWDLASRMESRELGVSNTTARRADALTRWVERTEAPEGAPGNNHGSL